VLRRIILRDILTVCAEILMARKNKDQWQEMQELRGEEAQSLLDLLQEVCVTAQLPIYAANLTHS
jgi:hypothetical protein